MSSISSSSSASKLRVDRVSGMIYGLAIGDALGAPHEFSRVSPKIKYTGIINTEHTLCVQFQFAKMILPPATTTDDTAMTLALFECLLDNDMQYNEESVCIAYWKFANSIKTGLGRNTRSLFKFKCQQRNAYKGYKRRYDKGIEGDLQQCESNGSLMRSSPLVLAGSKLDDPDQDFALTNPNPTNEYCSQVYKRLMTSIYDGLEKSTLLDVLKATKDEIPDSDVKLAIEEALESKSNRNIGGRDKGWVCHCLYAALRGFFLYDTMQEAMDWVVQIPNSDCDTTAAVCGSLWGAYLGLSKMSKEPKTNKNIEIITLVSPEGRRLQSLLNRFENKLNKDSSSSNK
jgi:ADP-ribosyl-[dinitrogen reductase] hydrolase